MKPSLEERRSFLGTMGGAAGAAWIAAQWPALAAAAQHAHAATGAPHATTFEILTAEQAREVAAIAARIIPTDDEPGATEAGVVYFIDRALKTFASDSRATYESGIKEVNEITAGMFPGTTRFSAASVQQQDQVLTEISKGQKAGNRFTRPGQTRNGGIFFSVIWEHTLLGFLVDPDGGGNRNYVGWKVIGRDPAHSFSPPFGEYDRNYPGWHSAGRADSGEDKA